MLAGFEAVTEGSILLAGQDIAPIPPNKRAVNMMFQSYALFPHLSIWENIAFGLKREGKSKGEIETRVSEMLKLTRLEKFKNRKPHQISGGQRQRVALARSLAKAPKLLLLDEPLGALDKKLRQETQFELMDIQEKTGTTFVIVTHDQEEAMTVASRVAVMDEGRIVQVATPEVIYEAPNSRYVADFIGDVNLLEGTAKARPEATKPQPEPKPEPTVEPEPAPAPAPVPQPVAKADRVPQPNALGEWLHDKLFSPILGPRPEPLKSLPPPEPTAEPVIQPAQTPTQKPIEILPGGIEISWAEGQPGLIAANGDKSLDGRTVALALRPEKMRISIEKPTAPNILKGRVIDIAYLGNVSTYHVELADGTMIKAQMANTRRIARREITWEDTVWVSFSETAGVVLEA
jgi:ABC-type Fe3+/spermidine/putrescine transport system ATPase subunit